MTMNEINIKYKCVLCGEQVVCGDEFIDHLSTCHMIGLSQYYEYANSVPTRKCMCDNELYRPSIWFNIYNTCNQCNNNRMYFESSITNVNLIYDVLCSNKFIRLFILDKNLRSRIIKFNILEYCLSLNILLKKFPEFDDKINLFNISLNSGLSPYLDTDLKNVILKKSEFKIKKTEMIMCDNKYYQIEINGNKYKIMIPEKCEYNNGSHYRYNILNKGDKFQSSKKLLLSSGSCIKLYNTAFDGCKSILKVKKNDTDVYSSNLTEDEIRYIKFYIMSNPSLLRYVLNILIELIKNSDLTYDYCFLLNRVTINPLGKFTLIIKWTLDNSMIDNDNEKLNISII